MTRRHIGKMRHPIELFGPARNPDGSGGFIRGDAKLIDAWAEIRPMKSFEKMQHAQLEQVRTHKGVVRYDERIKQGMFLVYDARVFYIEAVTITNERDRFMDLELREDGRV